ncbi:unnamed protein product, partial [marine sediment metagenome]
MVCPVRSWVDNLADIRENKQKGGETMTLPRIITGQPISGQQFGQAILNFLP